MSRDYRLYADDILKSIEKINQYVHNLDKTAFSKDSKTVDAVIRNLEIIGEASKNIPEDVKLLHPHVEWKKIAGMRDILAHEYFGIDIDILWDILETKLQNLEENIRRIIHIE